MKNRYETVFILTPVLSEDQAKEAVNKYKDLVKSAGGKILHQEKWGLKKLAYPIQKKSTGFYQLLQFDAPGDVIEKLELNYRRDERVIRFLTFKLDKYAFEYSIKRKGNLKSKEEK